MNKKDILGYGLIIGLVIIFILNSSIIDTTNYKDYELSEAQLSKEKPKLLKSKPSPYCTDEGSISPGFYDIKALGSSSEKKGYAMQTGSYIPIGDFLNDIYIADTECIFVDGDISLIPSSHNRDYLGDEFELKTTSDLVVGENIDPGKYRISSDIPKGATVFISSNNNNKIANNQLSVSIYNIGMFGFDNKLDDVEIVVKDKDVISFELSKYIDSDTQVYSSFPLKIKRID